jgi:hypothetical protein
MIATAHVAAGAVASMVAVRATTQPVGRVVLAVVLSLASHMAMDAIPHSEYRFVPGRYIVRVALVESIVACVIAALIVRRRLPPGSVIALAAGIFASLLPDVQFGADLFLSREGAATTERIGDFFHMFHAKKHGAGFRGIGVEITVAVLLFSSLALFPRRASPAQPRGS